MEKRLVSVPLLFAAAALMCSCDDWVVQDETEDSNPPPDDDGGAGADDEVEETAEETDTDPIPCPIDSGWPCVCDLTNGTAFCNDWSLCGQIEGLEGGLLGICLAGCEATGEQCDDTPWDADATCALIDYSNESLWCGLLCDHDDECPPHQTCQLVADGHHFCHP